MFNNLSFDKVGDLAKKASSFAGDQKPGNNDNSGSNNNQGSSEDQWNKVGEDAKETVSDFKDRQAKGESIDYTKLGGVAKQAAGAYNAEGGPKDLQSIGKAISAGFTGGGGARTHGQPEGKGQQGGQQGEQQQ